MIREIKFLFVFILASITILQKSFAQWGSSHNGGLGVKLEIDNKSKFPKIKEVISGLPAEQMHLIPNDFITYVNHQSTYNLSLDDVIKKITGPIGTQCQITIWRNNIEYPLTFTRTKIDDWQPGKTNDYYHIQASNKYGVWHAQPGYVFLNPNNTSGDFRTRWQPGMIHPNYHVISSGTEGYWNEMPGYKFVSNYGLETIWTPNIHYDDKKIISGETEGTWQAYAGYIFKNPSESLEVVPQNESSSSLGTALIEVSTAAILQYFFGDNLVSDYLYEEGVKDGINYLKQ